MYGFLHVGKGINQDSYLKQIQIQNLKREELSKHFKSIKFINHKTKVQR